MNEQLLKLAKESGISLRGFPMNPQMIYPSELQKFAELIVRECLAQSDKMRDSLEQDGENEQALGADWAGLAIARHFGVE